MRIAIDAIIVGERRREDMGDITGLAESIQRHGLLHPVVIDDESRLVAGERRLRSCQSLGWADIEVTPIGLLTDHELREIELEENLRRKDLSSYERAKTLTELAETAAEILKAAVPDLLAKSANKSGPGRPPKPDAQEKIADRIGEPDTTLRYAKHHVETADAYPFMQGKAWRQYHVLEAREYLGKIPEAERAGVVTMMTQPGMGPQSAIKIAQTLAFLPALGRAEVFALSQSEDSRDRSLALTKAFETPNMPDPRLGVCREFVKFARRSAREFPDDPQTPAIKAVAKEIQTIMLAIQGSAGS